MACWQRASWFLVLAAFSVSQAQRIEPEVGPAVEVASNATAEAATNATTEATANNSTVDASNSSTAESANNSTLEALGEELRFFKIIIFLLGLLEFYKLRFSKRCD